MERTASVRGRRMPRNQTKSGSFGAIERDDDGRLWVVKRELDPRLHKLHRFDAWALDAQLFRDLRARAGVGVRLVTLEGQVLEASVAAFAEHGVPFDHGFGRQVRLASKWWRKRGQPGGQLELAL